MLRDYDCGDDDDDDHVDDRDDDDDNIKVTIKMMSIRDLMTVIINMTRRRSRRRRTEIMKVIDASTSLRYQILYEVSY